MSVRISFLCALFLFVQVLSVVHCVRKQVNVNFANIFSTLPPNQAPASPVVIDPHNSDVDSQLNVNFQYLLNNVQSVCTVQHAQLQAYCATRTFTANSHVLNVYANTMIGLCRDSLLTKQPSACVQPGGTIDFQITLNNTGTGSWFNDKQFNLTLVANGKGSDGKPFFGDAALYLLADVEAGAESTGTFVGLVRAPRLVGVYDLTWTFNTPCGAVHNVSTRVEVTCSDQIFCNGVERYINGECVSPKYSACEDYIDCTLDFCDEENQRCAHRMDRNNSACDNVPSCRSTGGGECVPDCDGKQCGGDGCGDVCGNNGGLCANRYSCTLNGTCIQSQAPGSCANPYALLQGGAALVGTHVIQTDTSLGTQETIASCNPFATATQVIYSFVIPNDNKSYAVDIRLGNGSTPLTSTLDTVVELRTGRCYDPEPNEQQFFTDGENQDIWCSDDATPPGGVGSRIATWLPAGTYYIVAGGYNAQMVGPATLTVKITQGYLPQCLSRWCGPDGGGGDCGPCDTGLTCDEYLHCIPAPTTAECSTERCGNGTRVCGHDGCGGFCGPLPNGACPGDQLCVLEDGTCKSFPVCDHFHPVCSTQCTVNQFCASDCQCHYIDENMPDLVVDQQRLADSILFSHLDVDTYACAFAEHCVGGTGRRRLIRFDTTTVNQGNLDMVLPLPPQRPDIYIWGNCHNHYHFQGYAQYRLLNSDMEIVASGFKQGYCAEDSNRSPLFEGPNLQCIGVSTCDNPGISAGWSDVYGNDIDCQWIDITDVAPGNYTLRLELNVDRRMLESTQENNVATVEVVIPPDY